MLELGKSKPYVLACDDGGNLKWCLLLHPGERFLKLLPVHGALCIVLL